MVAVVLAGGLEERSNQMIYAIVLAFAVLSSAGNFERLECPSYPMTDSKREVPFYPHCYLAEG